MKKQLLNEINRYKQLMGIVLITEAGKVADEFLIQKEVTFRYGSITKIFTYLENYFLDSYQIEGDVLKHLDGEDSLGSSVMR